MFNRYVMVGSGGAHGLVETHQLAPVPLADCDVQRITSAQWWCIGETQASRRFEIHGLQLQQLEACLPQLLKALPGHGAFAGLDHPAAALHGQRRGEFGLHPAGDLPWPFGGRQQELFGDSCARFVHQACDQQCRIEIDRCQ